MRHRILYTLLSLAVSSASLAQNINIVHDYLRSGYRQILKNNQAYRIPFDSLVYDFRLPTMQQSPIVVHKGTNAVIEVRKGQTLKVKGSNAQTPPDIDLENTQAYPGILIEEGATLVIMGDGTVIAEGGDGGEGVRGKMGGIGITANGCLKGGEGGQGGNGGSGAAPGIGARGGKGGKGGKTATTKSYEDKDKNEDIAPITGHNGEDGKNGENMGTLILIGNIDLQTSSGSDGKPERWFGLAGCGDEYRYNCVATIWPCFKAGAGGGGGNGAAGGAAKYSIGGGAPGAGAGGSGGGGGISGHKTGAYDEIKFRNGGGGRGGEQASDRNAKLAGRHGEGNTYNNQGLGGKGGNAGSYGKNGTFYYTPGIKFAETATFDSINTHEVSKAEDIRSKIPASLLPYATFSITGPTWSDGATTMSLLFGQQMPATDIKPLKDDPEKGNFLGYYDEHGYRIYDKDGKLNIDANNNQHNFYKSGNEWHVASYGDIKLSPRYSGHVMVSITHYMEDPNWNGFTTSKQRYYKSGYKKHDSFTIPVATSSTELKYNAFVDHNGNAIIDHNNYTCAKSDTTITLAAGSNEPIKIEFFYDCVSHKLSWEGMSEEFLANYCTNRNDYSKEGSYKFGQAINPPSIRPHEGKVFGYWEKKDGDKWIETEISTIQGGDITLRPHFYDITFKADTLNIKGGIISLSKSKDISYGKEVTIVATPDKNYRFESVLVRGKESNESIEVVDNRFHMPNEDVIVEAVFEYHPFNQLKIYASTESGVKSERIMSYVIKDEGEIYTDNNDYYEFSDDVYRGKISDMTFTKGDRLLIHTDFKGDNGSRKAMVYQALYKDGEAQSLLDLETRLLGTYHDAYSENYEIRVDSIMTLQDLVVEILWTEPRWDFDIDVTTIGNVKISKMYANGRDITEKPIAYDGEQIEFIVETEDPDFDESSIAFAYEDGFEHIYDFVVAEDIPNVRSFTFKMPGADVELMLSAADIHYITTIYDEDDPAMITAPACARVGMPVKTNIVYKTQLQNEYNAENLAVASPIVINGVDITEYALHINNERNTFDYKEHLSDISKFGVNSKKYSTPRITPSGYDPDTRNDIVIAHDVFIMPDEDVVLTVKKVGSADDIQNVVERREEYSTRYNLIGCKVNREYRGLYIQNGKIYLKK